MSNGYSFFIGTIFKHHRVLYNGMYIYIKLILI